MSECLIYPRGRICILVCDKVKFFIIDAESPSSISFLTITMGITIPCWSTLVTSLSLLSFRVTVILQGGCLIGPRGFDGMLYNCGLG